MKRITLFLNSLLIVITTNSQILQPQEIIWAKGMGNKGYDSGNSITIDNSGNVYTLGYFEGNVDFDPGAAIFNLSSEGESDVFISKIDVSGNFVWASRIGGTGWDKGYSIQVDKAGNIYVTGIFSGIVDFDPGVKIYNLSASSSDIFILKLNPLGNFDWAKKIGGYGSDICFSMVVDKSGNIYTTGSFEETADFDPGSGTFYLKASGKTDIFISKLDTSGNFVWAKRMGGTLLDYGKSIALDNSGNIYTLGSFQGKVDFDPDTSQSLGLTSSGDYDIFISKIDISGNFVWAKRMGGISADIGHSLVLDASNNIYTSGYFYMTADFDPGLNTCNLTAPAGEIFITKLNAFGDFVWAKSIAGGNQSYSGNAIAVDAQENVYITGSFWGAKDFDPGLGTYTLRSEWIDIFISKLDVSGNFMWAKKLGGKEYDEGLGIKLDSSGNIYLTGFFGGTAHFGIGAETINLTASDSHYVDIFVCKIKQDSCTDMALVIDSLRNSSCMDSTGYASSHTLHGIPPYNYLWKTEPPIKDSKVNFTSNGIYSLTVTDANGCSRTTSVIINGYLGSGFDLKANLTTNNFRPGRQSSLSIDRLNDRCSPIKGQLSVILDKLVTYNNSYPTPNGISGDTIIWNFSNLNYNSEPIKPIINIMTKTNATIGDTVCFDIIVTPISEDFNPYNNKKWYCYPVRNSCDPNIKSVYPPGTCQQGYVLKNKPLTYTVQFQNTGNAEAIDIYILDTLDAHLDIKSLRILGQSHKPPITEILPGRVLKFRFDNINLPDSFSDEKGSHGYVVYEIMPDSSVVNGSQVLGKAGIYFDFNPPVFTNEVKNTLTNSIPSCDVGIHNPKILKPIHIYPNPNAGNFTIEIENPGRDVSIDVFDMMGKFIKTVETIPNQAIYSVDLNSANGIYLVKVKNGGIVYNQKVVLGK